MNLDSAALYRAVESRDRRFEGRFVLGVTTTGIYCRPGCPARLPRRENVRFFACAAAAESTGFRPCRRCRPEASPGTPASLGTGATVARALRLIDEGGLDGAGIDELAGRLGLGGRHLRRLFVDQLGASPLSIARSRRVHFAKKLLDETDLPMAEIAAAAGFGSLRRFNTEVRAVFQRSPTELRRDRKGTLLPSADGSRLALRLAYKPPHDWQSATAFLRARAIPGVERIDERGYQRTIALGGVRGIIDVRPAASGAAFLELRVPTAFAPELHTVAARVGRVFDLGADPSAIDEHLALSPRLAPLVARRPGLRVPGAWDGFELAVRAVLGQQITVAGATTLSGRLVSAFGEALSDTGVDELTHLFPTPSALAEADIASIGMPRARGETIRALAAAVRDRALTLDLPPSPEAEREKLAAIPGIGAWTVEYIALRAFGEPDAFPASDLALRKACSDAGVAPNERAVERLAEPFRPFRAYAAMHLWNSLSSP
jgi:AraC family transcriptional regulator, regulatory protein of adaptative response / DNA-3-methyladenine glycosylase II